MMKAMGLRAYRSRVSWPRVIPDGTGRDQRRGLDFYDRLVDDLSAPASTPGSRCFIGTFPGALPPGRLAQRDIAGWFAEYASRWSPPGRSRPDFHR